MKAFPGRITVDPDVCGGRPFFRGTRIPVYVVIEMLSNRERADEIFSNFPDLTPDDLKDALAYARNLAELPAASVPQAAA
jgi:uncharacterized protein (DUF433 family)